MKNLNFAVIIGKDDHYRAYTAELPENGNIASLVQRKKNMQVVQFCNTKKAAKSLVDAWNDDFRQNGTLDESLL